MTIPEWINAVLEIVGAIGITCSALSKLPLGKTSAVLAHLGTNFIQAAKELGSETKTATVTRITIPPKGDS